MQPFELFLQRNDSRVLSCEVLLVLSQLRQILRQFCSGFLASHLAGGFHVLEPFRDLGFVLAGLVDFLHPAVLGGPV